MARSQRTTTGIISVHRRGFGFVAPFDRKTYPQDIFIPPDEIGGAIHGDTVEVIVLGSRDSRGPEGSVVEVVKRARTHLVGIVTDVWEQGVMVHVPLFGRDALVSAKRSKKKIEIESRVRLKVQEWGDHPEETVATVDRVIGHVQEPQSDIPFAVEEHLLRHAFKPALIKEVDKFPSRVLPGEIAKRLDLREMESITIDPASAKDFDDALHLKCDAKGQFHLAVHIADVSHYVQRGSPLDQEARVRCNSTYFPGYCIPMLPPRLADELCSLKPNVNRLAVTALLLFDRTGKLLKHEIKRSVIRSRKRFTYEEARAVLDGKSKSPHAAMLRDMVKLCELLKKERRARGGVEFALPEVSIQVDEKGQPTGTRLIEYDITHQLVEEFMLKTNEVVARHLTDLGLGAAYRVHEEPAPENLAQFSQLAAAFGFKLPYSPTPADFQALFDRAHATPYGDFLAVAYIRSLKLATYSPDNIGHYGLSLEHYCHFTSPIRRYADLVIHRLLFGNSYDRDELRTLTKACSDQERISAKAEESVLRMKKMRLLAKLSNEKPHRTYEAVVTRVNAAGIVFELTELMLEGFLHVSQLEDDYYIFDGHRQELFGESLGTTYKAGVKIAVGTTMVDLTFGEIGWYLE